MQINKLYRINSVYHLLIVLCLIDKSDNNILILGDKSLYPIFNDLRQSNLFDKVICSSYPKNIVTKSFRVFIPLILKVKRLFIKKDFHIYTCPNDIEYKVINYFARAKKISLMEDGIISYYNKNNPLYLKSPKTINERLKWFIGLPYINIYKLQIDEYFLAYPDRLKKSIPEEFNYLNDIIIHFDVNKEILKHNNVINIRKVFKLESLITVPSGKKKVILITQPLVEDNKVNESELIKVYNELLSKYDNKLYQVYIKQHPRELGNKYSKLNVNSIEIPQYIPFEILSLNDIVFDVGITYESTAMNVGFIKHKIYIKEYF